MTRHEEWATQETEAETFAAASLSQITGRHKRNTRDRGKYNGYSKSAVIKLIQVSQNAQERKRHFTCSPSEKAALFAYCEELLANAGLSVSQATPDCLKYDGGIAAKTTAVDPFIECGSIECRPDKW
jgi:hypothetical protein